MLIALALLACSTPNADDTAAAPVTDTAVEPMLLVGIPWAAPDRLPWQAVDWCPAAHQLNYDSEESEVLVACSQVLELLDGGAAVWTITVSPIDEADAALVIPAAPLEVAWSDAGPGAGGYDRWVEIDGMRWLLGYENDPGAPIPVYAWGAWFDLVPVSG
jgi:hypothetical protein